VENKDYQLEIIINELNVQNEWQRHNENQRAQLTNILLLISAGLVALLPKDLSKSDWEIPVFLIGIGVFGILAVLKYWERFMYHATIDEAYQKLLEPYFPKNEDGEYVSSYLKTRYDSIKRHEANFILFKDKYFMQHWLWIGVFSVISIMGGVLFLKVLNIA